MTKFDAMAKIGLGIFGLVIAGNAFSTTLTCVTKNGYNYWNDVGPIEVRATIENQSSLTNVSLNFKNNSNLGASEGEIHADENYRPRSPLFKDHLRFSTGDAWCTYNILVSRMTLQTESTQPTIFLQQLCEGGTVVTNKLRCKYDQQ